MKTQSLTVDNLSSIKIIGILNKNVINCVKFYDNEYTVYNQTVFEKNDFLSLLILLDTTKALSKNWVDSDLFKNVAIDLKERIINIWKICECIEFEVTTPVGNFCYNLNEIKEFDIYKFYSFLGLLITMEFKIPEEISNYVSDDKILGILLHLEHLEENFT